MKNEETKNRIIWVDNVKAIAIILVALGHLFQSFAKSGIIEVSPALIFFNSFIYTFHVQLFFICSGFLYQKTSKVNNLSSYTHNAVKKIISFGVPYFIFSTVSILLKTIFADSVNSQAGGYFETLLLKPEAPYWFLYTLLLIFLITPTAKNKKASYIIFGCSAIAYIIILSTLQFVPKSQLYVQLVYKTVLYLIWFALGILLASIKTEKLFSPLWIIGFIGAGAAEYFTIKKIMPENTAVSFLISLITCFSVIGMIGWLYRKNSQTPFFRILSKYTMPIFLMHTIFAAGIRAVLFKINITNSAVHLIAGLIASFVLPVIAQLIMNKIHLDIIIYPLRYIKIGKKKASK